MSADFFIRLFDTFCVFEDNKSKPVLFRELRRESSEKDIDAGVYRAPDFTRNRDSKADRYSLSNMRDFF